MLRKVLVGIYLTIVGHLLVATHSFLGPSYFDLLGAECVQVP